MAISASKISFHLAFFFLLVAVAPMIVKSSFVTLKYDVVYPNKVNSPEAHGMGELEEINVRRTLAGNGYISYAALAKNNVPCNNRGQSYYNCAQTGQANPYTRGCTVATRCARR